MSDEFDDTGDVKINPNTGNLLLDMNQTKLNEKLVKYVQELMKDEWWNNAQRKFELADVREKASRMRYEDMVDEVVYSNCALLKDNEEKVKVGDAISCEQCELLYGGRCPGMAPIMIEAREIRDLERYEIGRSRAAAELQIEAEKLGVKRGPEEDQWGDQCAPLSENEEDEVDGDNEDLDIEKMVKDYLESDDVKKMLERKIGDVRIQAQGEKKIVLDILEIVNAVTKTINVTTSRSLDDLAVEAVKQVLVKAGFRI